MSEGAIVILWGNGDLHGPFRIEWRSTEFWSGHYGRWLGHHRVFWHFGPLVVSWARGD